MATPLGGPGNTPILIATASITLSGSAATALTYTVPTGYSGHLNINECFARTTTTIAADSTVPTITVKKGSTTIGTLTYTDGDAANGTLVVTPAASYRSGVELAAADTVVIAHTQAVDSSSAAGASTFYLSLSQGKG